jgi:hypothetical protein
VVEANPGLRRPKSTTLLIEEEAIVVTFLRRELARPAQPAAAWTSRRRSSLLHTADFIVSSTAYRGGTSNALAEGVAVWLAAVATNFGTPLAPA